MHRLSGSTTNIQLTIREILLNPRLSYILSTYPGQTPYYDSLKWRHAIVKGRK
jgi:hypothetical protein